MEKKRIKLKIFHMCFLIYSFISFLMNCAQQKETFPHYSYFTNYRKFEKMACKKKRANKSTKRRNLKTSLKIAKNFPQQICFIAFTKRKKCRTSIIYGFRSFQFDLLHIHLLAHFSFYAIPLAYCSTKSNLPR